MIGTLLLILTLAAALGCALMAGMFFTFSNFVMRALGGIKPAEGIAAMQRINIDILNPVFFVAFMGTALLSIVLPLALIWQHASLNAVYLIAGSVSYLVGVMVVTIVRNVPMNNALEAHDAESDAGSQYWQRYLVNWTRWNHVRTVASVLGTLLFILALV